MLQKDALIEDILSKITFRFIQPETPGANYDSADLSKVEAWKALDIANTNIWDKQTQVFNFDLITTPRMSTVANAYLINRLVQNMPLGEAYLNIGVWCGFSFFAGIVGNETKHCIGVDNFSDERNVRHIFEHQYEHFKSPLANFYGMDYLDYFATVHKEPIGVYFYDGDHAYEHQLKALEVADPYMTAGSYAIIDDTNSKEPYEATMDFVNSNPGYGVVLDVKTHTNGHPTFWDGLLVIKKN
jgi:hypothetical protein